MMNFKKLVKEAHKINEKRINENINIGDKENLLISLKQSKWHIDEIDRESTNKSEKFILKDLNIKLQKIIDKVKNL